MGIAPLRSDKTLDESGAWHKVNTSIQFENGHYVGSSGSLAGWATQSSKQGGRRLRSS